jgi:hypothetical protein
MYFPINWVVSKQLLRVYDKSIIFNSLSGLKFAGILTSASTCAGGTTGVLGTPRSVGGNCTM